MMRYGTPRAVRPAAMWTLVAALVWPGLAAAAGPTVVEAFINAPTAEVWRLFTTAEGYKAAGAAHADVELRIGGLIRSHEDAKGRLGDPQTTVHEILAYEPERMLAVRLKHSPARSPHPTAIEGTWSVFYFAAAGDNMTQVRLVGLGYGDTPDSLALRRKFEESGRSTLDRLARRYWPKCAACKAD